MGDGRATIRPALFRRNFYKADFASMASGDDGCAELLRSAASLPSSLIQTCRPRSPGTRALGW